MTPSTDGRPVVNRLGKVHSPVVVTSPLQSPARSHPWWANTTAVVVLVLLGIGLRAAALGGDRNLWIDEAMLALNLIERTPAQLLEPLDWNQGAPVGFLLLTKASIMAVGPSEVGLRLVPFLGSIVGVIAFAGLAISLLPRPAAVLAVALLAVSPYLMGYASECKQYETDAALAIVLFAIPVDLTQCGQGRGIARVVPRQAFLGSHDVAGSGTYQRGDAGKTPRDWGGEDVPAGRNRLSSRSLAERQCP